MRTQTGEPKERQLSKSRSHLSSKTRETTSLRSCECLFATHHQLGRVLVARTHELLARLITRKEETKLDFHGEASSRGRATLKSAGSQAPYFIIRERAAEREGKRHGRASCCFVSSSRSSSDTRWLLACSPSSTCVRPVFLCAAKAARCLLSSIYRSGRRMKALALGFSKAREERDIFGLSVPPAWTIYRKWRSDKDKQSPRVRRQNVRWAEGADFSGSHLPGSSRLKSAVAAY